MEKTKNENSIILIYLYIQINIFKKIHAVVDKGSNDLEQLVKKAENFVEQTEELIKASDNTIKIIGGFVVASMAVQMLASYTQLRVNVKMLSIIRGIQNEKTK